ncbi:MAG: type II secretion system protein, partial [Candidatus Pacebacteria bacterium]|nr:type II secretion system protein [Candidatus Paceibacterota bacterium]MDD4875490.1 type II secretion system protein [Candidatus Paceibacterota bacterium]
MDKAKFLSFFQKPRKKAFTLVEILTVVGIILIMAAAVVPAINSFLMNSRDSQRRADLEKLKVALQVYYTYNDSYIALDESGNWFSTEENTDFQQILNSQYIDRIPEDPLYPQTDDSGEAYSYYYQAST